MSNNKSIENVSPSEATNDTTYEARWQERLDHWAKHWREAQQTTMGYPGNQVSALHEFYQWYVASGMDIVNLNNAGDPMIAGPEDLSSKSFEREVVEYFAPLYDFDCDDMWGIVTHSGTDGNAHAIYYGLNFLRYSTGEEPIVYFSDEAHYSVKRLAHLQNIEVRPIKSDAMGRMIADELERALDTTRPVLIIYAMGSTFKGAIDDIRELNAVIERHPTIPAVYRHVDAALFGSYLPYTIHRDMVSHKLMHYESIAISGHKFFGIDSPCGIFLCTRRIYDYQTDYNVSYLNSNMRMISCSRDALSPLKFWWLIQTIGTEGWAQQAQQILECTAYLTERLRAIGWPCWVNAMSNTVIIKRPGAAIVNKYTLALGEDKSFGGELAHIVVMQHVTKEKIDQFVAELQQEQ